MDTSHWTKTQETKNFTEPMKRSCLRDVIPEVNPLTRRQFDVLRRKLICDSPLMCSASF